MISLSLFAEKLTLSKASGAAPLGPQVLCFSVLVPAGAAEPQGESDGAQDERRHLPARFSAWLGMGLSSNKCWVKEHVRAASNALATSLQL